MDKLKTPLFFLMLAMLGAPALATAKETLIAKLKGAKEVPVCSTTGSGRFRATIKEGAIDYKLTYAGFEGNVTVAHIHLGKKTDAGGIIAFLCGGGDKPACTTPSGSFTGTVDAADVIGPEDQGIDPGEFDEVVRMIRDGLTYANVHSSICPVGEVRGQIRRGN